MVSSGFSHVNATVVVNSSEECKQLCEKDSNCVLGQFVDGQDGSFYCTKFLFYDHVVKGSAIVYIKDCGMYRQILNKTIITLTINNYREENKNILFCKIK